MREVCGDLWVQAVNLAAEATAPVVVVITTNGFIKTDGTAVMGRGVAQQAKMVWPNLPGILGRCILEDGNNVHWLGYYRLQNRDIGLLSFPVKSVWWEKASFKLIERSVQQLKTFADDNPDWTFLLPRPGCGNGHLEWKYVKPLLVNLDDRFIVVNNEW